MEVLKIDDDVVVLGVEAHEYDHDDSGGIEMNMTFEYVTDDTFTPDEQEAIRKTLKTAIDSNAGHAEMKGFNREQQITSRFGLVRIGEGFWMAYVYRSTQTDMRFARVRVAPEVVTASG